MIYFMFSKTGINFVLGKKIFNVIGLAYKTVTQETNPNKISAVHFMCKCSSLGIKDS